MKKERFLSAWLALVMVLALVLTPVAAQAAETAAEAAAGTVVTPLWDDLSYTKFLLKNTAFYELNDKVLKAETMEDLVEALQKCDPWAQYYPAETYSAQVNYFVGEFVGIGVYLRADGDRTIVAGVIANSPAEKAGFKNGDYIVEVDGKNTRNATTEELQSLLRGEENTMVSIKYVRNGVTREVIMNRKRIVEPSMEYWFTEGSIGYTRITTFTTHTGEELADAVKMLKKQGMTALIVDLRDCPGGELEGAVESSAVLAGEGPMLFFMDKAGWQGYVPIDTADRLGLPLAVLINGNTASSAELVAANVQDAGTGALIGEGSYGKGVVQTMRPLPSGAGISFTTDKYISHGYQDIDAQGGVLPDIYVGGRDTQRDKAVSWLKEQLEKPAFLKFYAGLNGYSRGGVWQSTPASAYLTEGTAYVPLNLTLGQLGWQLQVRDGLLYAENGEQRLIVDTENNKAISSQGKHNLVLHGKDLYLPVSLLRQYGYTVTWEESERSVTIEK